MNYTPSSLNQNVRLLLEAELGLVAIEGEISNLVRAASGHLYFSLKDSAAQVRCAMFKQRASYLKLKPENGMLVGARARVTMYEPRGEFQLVIESLEEAGAGRLNAQFEALKASLLKEGLFDPARKRLLPRFPRGLAVVTSPSGAAIHDVLSVLKRRYPLLPVVIYAAQVQGAQAPAELKAALASALASGLHDVVLITRGGGSLEDLQAFNDEALVRLVASAPIPIVSAVGHETDFTLTDFAADVRAATPSAAAELIAPDQQALRDALARQLERLLSALQLRLERHAQRVDQAALRLKSQHPLARIGRNRERLRGLAQRLPDQRRALERKRERIAVLKNRLDQRTVIGLSERRQRLRLAAARLHALSPLSTLARGYSILLDERGFSVSQSGQVKPGDELEAVLANGRLRLSVL